MAADTRARIEQAAADLIARGGYSALGLKALSDAASATYGSIYHHFPGGKEEIAAAAVGTVATARAQALDAALHSADGPLGMVDQIFELTLQVMSATDWEYGCAVGAAAQDGSAVSEQVREATAAGFLAMRQTVADGLLRAGVDPERVASLAMACLSAYEGAIVLARALRTDEPLRATAGVMRALIAESLPDGAPGTD